jgi:hypothetical protein
VIGTQPILVPADGLYGVLNNQSGQRLRVFATLLGEGPLDVRLAPVASSSCGTADTLSRRGQSLVLVLDKGCALHAQARGLQPSLLRVQTEGPKLDP